MDLDLEGRPWLHFLTRFSPLVSLDGALLIMIFIVGVGFQEADNAEGVLYSELLGAARAPAAYQVAMVFDAFGWFTIGLSLVAFGRILQARSPVLSTLIVVAGIGHLLGFLGGLLRLTGIHGLAVEYAATTDPASLSAIRASFASLYTVISGLFLAGDILGTMGWLLVGIAVLKTHVLPRWVGGWTLASGIVVAAFTPLSEVDPVLAFPLLLTYIVAGIIVFHLVFAVKFWRVAAPPARA